MMFTSNVVLCSYHNHDSYQLYKCNIHNYYADVHTDCSKIKTNTKQQIIYRKTLIFKIVMHDYITLIQV